MRILVTGGTGFLGSRLVAALDNDGHDVAVLSRRVDEDTPDTVTSYQGDVRDKAALAKAMAGADVVYHLAICLDEANPEMWDINVRGTQTVVDACTERGVQQLVYMSSAGVLGETREPSKEDFPYRPKTRYEKSKAESETIIRASGVPFTIVRTTIIIGPNPIWAKIFEAARKGHPILGSGKNYFHLVSVDDVVRLLVLVAGNPKARNEIFHVASKDTPTYEAVYAMICDELGCAMTTRHVPVFLAHVLSFLHATKRKLEGRPPSLIMMKSSIDRLVRNRTISTDKARSVLGFEPRYTTKDALHATLAGLRIARLGYSDHDLAAITTVRDERA